MTTHEPVLARGADAPTPDLARDHRGLSISLGRTAMALSILAPLFLPAKVCTLLYLLLVVPLVMRRGFTLRRRLLRLMLPLFSIFALGLLVDYGSIEWRLFAGDMWRLGKPILLLYVGYMATRAGFRRPSFPQGIVVIGLAYASIYLLRLAFESASRGVHPLDLADTVVFGHFPEAFTIGVCLRYRKLGTQGGSLLRRAALVVCLLSIGLSGSRTWVVVGVVMMLAGASWLRGRGRVRAIVLTASVLVCVFLTPIGTALFTKGFDVALAEISPSSYSELGDISRHWRGFEAWQGLRAFWDGTVLQQTIGQGFGAGADLGFFMELSGDHYHHVTQFHNGFIWPLLKTGYLGMLFFAWWFWSLLGLCRVLGRQRDRAPADLCLGVVVSLVPTTLVVSGIFNNVSNDSMVLVLGGFMALTHRRE